MHCCVVVLHNGCTAVLCVDVHRPLGVCICVGKDSMGTCTLCKWCSVMYIVYMQQHICREPCAAVVQTRSTLCVTCRFVVAAERLGVRAARVTQFCGCDCVCWGSVTVCVAFHSCAVPWRGIARLCWGLCSAATQEGGEAVCVCVYCMEIWSI